MKIKECLIIYLHHRIIIFPLHLYINFILNDIFRKIDNWGLLKEGKLISGKEKYFKFFLEKEIADILNNFTVIFKKLNVKILTVFNPNYEINLDFNSFIKDKDYLIKSLVKGFSKKTKYFTDKIPQKIKFEISDFKYKDLKVGKKLGEVEEFLVLLNKKIK